MDANRKRTARPHTGPVVRYPLRIIANLLIGLPSSPDGDIDYEAADPQILDALREELATLIGVANNGSVALGHLLALAAPEVEGGEVSGDTMEGIGWLLTLLGDTAGWATEVKLRCDQVNSDYSPIERSREARHA